MVKLINKFSGGEMWVDDSRVDEYTAAGHTLAADISKAKIKAPEKQEEKADAPKKATSRKSVKSASKK